MEMELYGTLGAACRDRGTMLELFRAGMTGTRLNLSHVTLAECAPWLHDFWSAASEAGAAPRLVIDLQGPETRVGRLSRPVYLPEGETILLGGDGVPVARAVLDAARPGDRIVMDDSAFLLEALERGNGTLLCRVLRGGLLGSRKSVALPGRHLDTPTLTEEDWENLKAASRFGVTDILQPFVRGRRDVEILRAALLKNGLKAVRIMAKIENCQGLDKLDEIIAAADEICIARGDLGGGMPLWELPGVQKEIARRCREAGRPFCVATQLLWSMQERAVPTRAEVCDIYNAVLDGAGGLMLTGETAAGKYPVEAMSYLARTVREALAALAGSGKS